MSQPRYLVFGHESARGSDEVERVVESLARHERTELVWTSSPDDFDDPLNEFPDALVVVAGGDGSIHHLVNRLGHLGALARPVGLVPLGTGNDTARGLQLPLEIDEAVEHLVAGTPRRLALGMCPGGELMVNNAHAGIGVAAARTGADWKDRLGPAAYTAGSVAEGLGYEPLPATVRVDGRLIHEGESLAVLALLGPSAGGGLEPAHDVDPSERVLDFLVISGEAGRMSLAIAAIRGELDSQEGVVRARGATMEAAVAGTEWEVDGEFRDWKDPVTISIADQTWNAIA